MESKTQEAVPSKRATEPEKESDKKKKDEPTASFFSLFRFADRVDGVLYTIGIIGGIVNGLTMPAFSVVFGEMLDGFNPGEPGTDIMADVSKYAVIITLVGVLSWIAAYIEIACFTIAVSGWLASSLGLVPALLSPLLKLVAVGAPSSCRSRCLLLGPSAPRHRMV